MGFSEADEVLDTSRESPVYQVIVTVVEEDAKEHDDEHDMCDERSHVDCHAPPPPYKAKDDGRMHDGGAEYHPLGDLPGSVTKLPSYDEVQRGDAGTCASVPATVSPQTIVEVSPVLYGLSERSIRLGFIRKVYGILTAQILLMCAMIIIFMTVDAIKGYVQSSNKLFFAMVGSALGLALILLMLRKVHPLNLIIYFLFTVCMSFAVATAATLYNAWTVLQAAILTLTVLVALTIFTFQSRRDFMVVQSLCFLAMWIVLSAGLIEVFVYSSMSNFGYSVLGSICFSGYIVCDTHFILTSFEPEEYIMASMQLYLDVVNLFLYALSLLSKFNG